MSELKANLKNAVTTALKARDASRVQSLRMALSAIQKKEMDEQKDLNDDGVQKVLLTMVKQIQETIEQAKSLSRTDLVQAAEAEITIIREFLPQPLSENDVLKICQEIVESLKASNSLPAGGAAMGAVMKQAVAKIGSRSEGKIVQAAVKKSLGLN